MVKRERMYNSISIGHFILTDHNECWSDDDVESNGNDFVQQQHSLITTY